MKDPGFWNFVPVYSQRILVERVNVTAKWSSQEAAAAAPYLGLAASTAYFDPYSHTPNTDGFEPMWSTDVTVRGCRVENGDDCITIKSGSSNVLVEDLYVHTIHIHPLIIAALTFEMALGTASTVTASPSAASGTTT